MANGKKGYPPVKNFYPQNPEKYAGDISKIKTRSSWEIKFANYCDKNPSVVQWNSEDIVIPYWSSADNKQRKYHMDFTMTVRTSTGKLQTYLIEIKPYKQTIRPEKKQGKREVAYLNEMYTYQVNMDKWIHAKQYAESQGWIFIILTENELYPKGTPK